MKSFGEERDALWFTIIQEKYGSSGLVWEPKTSKIAYGTALWRSICNPLEEFREGVSHRVGNGEKVGFWEDKWLEDQIFQKRFPALYRIATSQNFKVADVLNQNGEDYTWTLNFTRRLYDNEVVEAAELLQVLQGFKRSEEEEDKRIWVWSKNKEFSVKSAYFNLHARTKEEYQGNFLWNSLWTPRAAFFMWLTVKNKVLTLDQLMRKGWQLPNRCFLCNCDGETNSHLLLHCRFTWKIWMVFLEVTGTKLATPKNIEELMFQWKFRGLSRQAKRIMEVLPAVIVWSIRKERNARAFRDEEEDLGTVINGIKIQAFRCVSFLEEFKGVSIETVVGRWESFLFMPP